MTANSKAIRAEPHVRIGTIIQRDAGVVIERWSRRTIEENPKAQRLHHEALLDHVPLLLHKLGQSLAESGEIETTGHHRPARQHAEQRWEAGWSLTEVVQDYQLLRIVLVEYLEEALGRPLRSREAMAIGLALDEAIAASVHAYVREASASARSAAERLEEANRRKDDFLALLGHELRNPLAPIRNAVQVLRLQPGDPGTVQWAGDLLDRQARHMTRLVDDLLDASRIARGKIVLQRERVDIARLVQEIAEDRRAGIGEAGLVLSLETSSGPLLVNGDPTRLAQIVGNLLQNAVKFTDRGGKVTVQVMPDEEQPYARIVVRDTGIGIAPELLPRLFEKFVQGDGSMERSRGGLGLGLALVKGLVELHGGEVQAASGGVGQGAEFTVRLPLALDSAAPALPPTPVHLAARPLSILIIEDNRDSAQSLQMLLELYGYKVAVAHDGRDGVQAAQRHAPDVVLCDLGLPVMSGYDVAAALRSTPVCASALIIAVSGYGSEADQLRCREAGFNLHMTKPVDLKELQSVLAAAPMKPNAS
jgi:signal transduction histidine kinase/CheY-like chemotaxis protein